jgi:hypothetical protein
MPPHRFGALFLTASLLSSSAGSLCLAQAPLQSQTSETLRYHLGNDPKGARNWADSSFDDRSWPAANRWPLPLFYSDGFVLVRVRVPVPVRTDSIGRLGLRLNPLGAGETNAIFVNGQPIAVQNSHAARAKGDSYPDGPIYDLPAGQVVPGSTATVAFRVSYPPLSRKEGGFDHAEFEINEIPILHLENRADHVATLLANVPDLALNGFILVLGGGLFVFWRWAGGRDILLCSAMLVSYPVFQLFAKLSKLGILNLPSPLGAVYFVLQAVAMAVTVEFIWTVHGLRSVYIKRLVKASWIVFNGAALFAALATEPSLLTSCLIMAAVVAAQVFNVITFFVNIWVLFVRKANRLVAAALALISVASTLGLAGKNTAVIGPFEVPYFDLTFFLCEFALFVMLGQRAWREWRARDALQAEFEAAREVQQRLVTPAVDAPGFRIESVYRPALQVGGDFFYIRPQEQTPTLVVVGDVSGKGLKAALTVSAIIGALRTMPALSPSQVLGALNRGLLGQMQVGFVTCCAAQISRDGEVTIANAGQLSPYLNGAEIPLAAGLPLGLDPDAAFEESHFLVPSSGSLTFLSDGIVEARNAAGELFGFDRTLRLSNSGPKAIAQAAIDFGQDDDITVVTLTRLEESEQPAIQPSALPSMPSNV